MKLSEKKEDFWVVIPAHLKSSRFPEKVLADIRGEPMINIVARKALSSLATKVIVATDSRRIKDALSQEKVDVILTDENHPSGSDRVFEAVERSGARDDQIIVNLQGDEPLIDPKTINNLAELKINSQEDVATVAARITSENDITNPNCVKLVINKENKGLYFSRSPIPFFRSDENSSVTTNNITYLRHIGIYSFSAGSLRSFVKFGECELENTERLEQLRWLWMGKQIKVLRDDSCLGLGVDTIEDLQKVLSHLQKMK